MGLGSLAPAQVHLANSVNVRALVEAQALVDFPAYLVPSDQIPVLFQPLEML